MFLFLFLFLLVLVLVLVLLLVLLLVLVFVLLFVLLFVLAIDCPPSIATRRFTLTAVASPAVVAIAARSPPKSGRRRSTARDQ
jgi:hypothetical protein